MAREQAVRSRNVANPRGPQVRAGVSIGELRALIELLNTSDIEELTFEHDSSGVRLTLRKPAPLTLSTAPGLDGAEPGERSARAARAAREDAADHAEPADAAAPDAQAAEQAGYTVFSPFVGIFRAAMKRGGAPLVHQGDTVEQGQVVGAVEALNVFNEVEAAVPGQVREVLVEDGMIVEYGQPLLVIVPVE